MWGLVIGEPCHNIASPSQRARHFLARHYGKIGAWLNCIILSTNRLQASVIHKLSDIDMVELIIFVVLREIPEI